MLVLKRKPQEQIIIDQRIVVTVLAIHGNRVRLGINAPPEVAIVRKELEVRLTQSKSPTTLRITI